LQNEDTICRWAEQHTKFLAEAVGKKLEASFVKKKMLIVGPNKMDEQ
jgi:hypothetical protein